jgi:dTDP-4-dehydrorhamnose reductase
MKILVLGGSGMLGHKLVQRLSRAHEVKYTLRGEFERLKQFGILPREDAFESVDAMDFDAVNDTISACGPDVVINAIGVVKQVAESNNVVRALTVNSIFPNKLAQLSHGAGFRLITMSTDCVFSGSRGNYSEHDIPDALDLYGQSKHWGEVEQQNCVTIRTSIIGRELGGTHGLFEWFVSQEGKAVNGYSRAIFSGFPTLVIADIILDIIDKHRELCGVYHISSDPISKFDLLTKINERFELDIDIKDAPEVTLDRSLDSTKFRNATGFLPPTWDQMIDVMASEDRQYLQWRRTNI